MNSMLPMVVAFAICIASVSAQGRDLSPDMPGFASRSASRPDLRSGGNCKSVAEFGGVPGSDIPSTAAFQAAYDAAGAAGTCIDIPAGTYDLEQVDITAYNNITTYCANRGNNAAGGTRLRALAPTTPAIFNVGVVSGIYFDGCTFTSRSQQTAGSYVRFNGSQSSGLSNFFMERGFARLSSMAVQLARRTRLVPEECTSSVDRSGTSRTMASRSSVGRTSTSPT